MARIKALSLMRCYTRVSRSVPGSKVNLVAHCEYKPAGLALHWRGLNKQSEEIRSTALGMGAACAGCRRASVCGGIGTLCRNCKEEAIGRSLQK